MDHFRDDVDARARDSSLPGEGGKDRRGRRRNGGIVEINDLANDSRADSWHNPDGRRRPPAAAYRISTLPCGKDGVRSKFRIR